MEETSHQMEPFDLTTRSPEFTENPIPMKLKTNDPPIHEKKAAKREKTPQIKRFRTVFTVTQLLELEREFDIGSYMTYARGKAISKRLGIDVRQIKFWFQNRRAKLKNKTKPPARNYQTMEKPKRRSGSKLVSCFSDRSSSPGLDDINYLRNVYQASIDPMNFFGQRGAEIIYETTTQGTNLFGQYTRRIESRNTTDTERTNCFGEYKMPVIREETHPGCRDIWTGANNYPTIFNGFAGENLTGYYRDLANASALYAQNSNVVFGRNRQQLPRPSNITDTPVIVDNHYCGPNYRAREGTHCSQDEYAIAML